MGCKVEKITLKNGQASDLFRDLSYAMPQSRALETYLHVKNNEQAFTDAYGKNIQGETNSSNLIGTAKFKLAEFDTYRQQADTMDYLASNFIETLRLMAATKSISTIGGINLEGLTNNPTVIPLAIKKTRDALSGSLRENRQDFTDEQIQLRNQAILNMPSYLATEQGLGPLAYKLKDYGVNIEVKETSIDVETEFDNLEMLDRETDVNAKVTQKERIYDMDILETGISTTITDNVKIYLKGLKRVREDYRYVSNRPIEYQGSELASTRPIRFELVVGKLYALLKGMQSPEEMTRRLQRALKDSPELAPIYQDILDEQNTPVEVVVNGRKTKYKPIQTALFSTFAKQDYNMFTIAEDNGKIIFFSSNTNSMRKAIQNRWAEDNTYILKQEKDLRDKDIAVIDTYLRKKGLRNALNRKTGPNMVELKEAAFLFQKAGFKNVRGEDLKNLIGYVQDNKARFSKDMGRDPFSIVKFFINTLPKKVLEGQDIFKQHIDEESDMAKYAQQGKFGESRNLNALSEVISKRTNDVSLGAFYSGRGTMVHPINQGSEAQDIFVRLNDVEQRQMFMKDPIYTHNTVLAALNDNQHAAMFDVTTMDVLNDNSKTANGVTYGNLSSFDAVVSKINGYFGATQNKGYFFGFSPTQADRGKLQALVLPKLDVLEKGSAKQLFKNGRIVEGEIKDWIENQVKGELTRIAQVKSSKLKYKNYAKNSTKFNLFTELNDKVSLEGLIDSPNSIDAYTSEAMTHMDDIFKQIIDNDIAYLEDAGIFTQKTGEFVPTTESRKALSQELGKGRRLSETELHNFLANNLITTYDQTLFYIGDLAFYDNTDTAIQKIDANKRFGLPFTPGTKLAIGEANGIGKYANIKILNEPSISSELAEVYQNIIETKDIFEKIKLADGAGFVSLERYKALMMSQGVHSDQLLQFIDDQLAWKPGQPIPRGEVNLEVLKGFYFRLQANKDGIIAPFNLKYSIMPVFPAYFEQKVDGEYKYPGMAAISQELRKATGVADEVVMSTAVKVGEVNAVDISDLADAEPIQIHNDSYRFPQVSVSKDKTEDRFGSQMRKLIVSNYDFTRPLRIGLENTDPSIALRRYNDAIKMLIISNGDDVYRQFLVGGKVNEATLIKRLLNDLENNPHNNIDYYRQALDVISDAKARTLPLNYPTIKYKIDSLINAAFRNRVNRLKLPGHSAVQVSSFGTMVTRAEISVGSDLKFIGFKGIGKASAIELSKNYKNGDKKAFDGLELTPAEIRITPKFFKNTLKKIAQKNVDKMNFDTKVDLFRSKLPGHYADDVKARATVSYRQALQHSAFVAEFVRLEQMIQDNNGNYSIEKIRRAGLDNIVLYRIPTQGKNSMLAAKIKDFIPAEMGSTIQVPAEIVDQAGSDFDIDKVFIEMTAFEETQGGFQGISYKDANNNVRISNQDQAKAYIMDFHRAVLTSTAYVSEILAPNTTDTLQTLVKEYGTGDDSMTANWGSVALQEIMRANNKAGKELISIASIAAVAHSIAPHIGTKFNSKIKIAGTDVVLGDMYNLEKEALISREIEEIQNAALDNAKDPLLGKLNIDDYTASTVLMLVSAGLGLRYATAIVNAPAVKELAKVYPIYARKYTPGDAESKALGTVKRKLGIKYSTTAKGKYKLSTYTEAKATANLSPKTAEDHVIALQAFLDIKEHARGLAEYQVDMNFDSRGTPTTVPGLLTRYRNLAGIRGTLAYARERGFDSLRKVGEEENIKERFPTESSLKAAIIGESRKIRLSEDKENYIYVGEGKYNGTKLERLSNYVGNSITRSSDALIAANTAGNTIDALSREFFDTGVVTPNQNISATAAQTLQAVLERVKDHFETTGEKVITDPKYLKVFDLKLKVGGEMDMITIDKNKVVRIYDFKTELRSTIADIMTGLDYSRQRAQNYIDDRYIKRGKQLNGYRGLLRNMHGVKAVELNIVPLGVSYSKDGSVVETVREPKQLFEKHIIIENAIIDSRVYETTINEKVLEKLGIDPIDRTVSVDPVKYMESYMQEMERYSIHKPLTVNREISNSASVYLQRILQDTEKAIGRLKENQQIRLFTELDTYLATNAAASRVSKSSLSRRMATGEYLKMTDPVSTESVAHKLKAYRDNMRAHGKSENPFTENLTILTQNGRKFIVFNNTVARGLTGEAKKEMMFYYEDLMDAPKGSMEEQLAKSLADYAVMHYGFSRGFNSFMEFIPPRAHVEYMGAKTGEFSKPLPEFFAEIYEGFDRVGQFNDPTRFVEMFVQNNWEKLPLETESIYTPDGDLNVNWRTDFISRFTDRNRIPPKYMLLQNRNKTELYGYTGTGYEAMQKKGLSGLAVEYQEGDSIFNEQVSTAELDGESKKQSASLENKAVISNIEEGQLKRAFDKAGDYETINFETPKEAVAWVNEMMKVINTSQLLTNVEKKFIRSEFTSATEDAENNYNVIKKINPDVNFNTFMTDGFGDVLEMSIAPNIALTKKIINCS
ncbi:MAG TPA: hypothetical protein ENI20_07750 [Bacteroides sp.]|nr:hypothetical protein [Bacteroides sp.]